MPGERVPYTSPCSSACGFGAVNSDTATITTAPATKPAIAETKLAPWSEGMPMMPCL
ncbi:hypothetical protein STREPTOSP366_26900 [Streptomyces variabilis]